MNSQQDYYRDTLWDKLVFAGDGVDAGIKLSSYLEMLALINDREIEEIDSTLTTIYETPVDTFQLIDFLTEKYKKGKF